MVLDEPHEPVLEGAVGQEVQADALGDLLAHKAALVADGARVRLERRTKNLKALLERATSDGYTAFATVSAGTTPDALEVKTLG